MTDKLSPPVFSPRVASHVPLLDEAALERDGCLAELAQVRRRMMFCEAPQFDRAGRDVEAAMHMGAFGL